MDTSQAVVTVTRTGGPDCYAEDPPLTQIGRAGAELVGRSLSERTLNIHTIYTSPSLRCLQVSLILINHIRIREPCSCDPRLFMTEKLDPNIEISTVAFSFNKQIV